MESLLDLLKEESQMTTMTEPEVATKPEQAKRVTPSITKVPDGTPAACLQLGDVVFFIDPETHAGVINPRVKAAVVAGIHPDGSNLALTVYGRLPGRLHPKIPYGTAEADVSFTWHHRPAKGVKATVQEQAKAK